MDYYLADLIQRDSVSNRLTVLRRAQKAYERFLSLLDTYSMLSTSDRKLYERYTENKDEFSLTSSNDAGARRDTKISRFKQENELKLKIEVYLSFRPHRPLHDLFSQFLSKVPLALQGDDAALREICLAEIQLSVHHSFHALDQTAQELKILALIPPTPPADPREQEADYRSRNGHRKEDYSERLDPSLSQPLNRGKAGPILSKEGKPLQPFTLLDSRQRLRDSVFRPDHSLPTMTIDEYLAEEKRRGGIVDGGGEASGRPAEPNEDDLARADVDTMKAREWDEFVETNPKGSGNTLNRG